MQHVVIVLTAWSVVGVALAASDEPAKLATSGRFDLSADTEAASIDDGQFLAGRGSIERMNWIPEADRGHSYTVSFSITHTGWREFSVRFTPVRSGTVSLTLMGPWEEASKGTIYKAEVLWDAISIEGATIENGGFESGSGRDVPGWLSHGGTVEAASPPLSAVQGRQVARTWHNATLAATLKVASNESVTIRGHARAVIPADFMEMRRIVERDTPAHRAAKRFMRGTNLGNFLEAPPGQDWGASYSAADFDQIKAEGFDHVRIPIAWHHYTAPGPDFTIKEEIFAKADALVNEAIKRGLGTIVNIHHFDAFTSDPAGQGEKFLAIWRQLAVHFIASPPGVAFELLNEPKDAASTERLNPVYAEAIREIRKTSPNRTIFVGPGKWNDVSELANLRMPDDERNLIVTIHCYDPYQFTHQGAPWDRGDVRRLKGIRFPGPPEKPIEIDPAQRLSSGSLDWLKRYNTSPADQNPSSPRAVRNVVQVAKEWSDYYGRPIHMGEFGAYVAADPESRARYYESFREALDEADIGWAMWDWKAGFRYWDDRAGRPAPGMRQALFPTVRP